MTVNVIGFVYSSSNISVSSLICKFLFFLEIKFMNFNLLIIKYAIISVPNPKPSHWTHIGWLRLWNSVKLWRMKKKKRPIRQPNPNFLGWVGLTLAYWIFIFCQLGYFGLVHIFPPTWLNSAYVHPLPKSNTFH